MLRRVLLDMVLICFNPGSRDVVVETRSEAFRGFADPEEKVATAKAAGAAEPVHAKALHKRLSRPPAIRKH